jgi:glycosyltransferase involved in cell wall biosynthesis
MQLRYRGNSLIKSKMRKKKIGIVGTRGIPNAYGGFEQFAEYLSKYLSDNGFEVYVYNSHEHPYQDSTWQSVNLIHKFDPESRLGSFGQFIYDFNCIIDCRKRHFDVILQLGYTSSSIWSFLMPKNVKLVTNMDGLEWKRTKYSKLVQSFLKLAEKWAVNSSDMLVADSLGIKEYIDRKYSVNSVYIPYGANLMQNPDSEILANYDLKEKNYYLVIARMEPENNIELIIQGYLLSNSLSPLVLIGNCNTTFGKLMQSRYKSKNVMFLGPIYNLEYLNNIRYYSKAYFHGHSVGGTNPSLLEAMASYANIIAHDNIFNRAILENDSKYFLTSSDIVEAMNFYQENVDDKSTNLNAEKIQNEFCWHNIFLQYSSVLSK